MYVISFSMIMYIQWYYMYFSSWVCDLLDILKINLSNVSKLLFLLEAVKYQNGVCTWLVS